MDNNAIPAMFGRGYSADFFMYLPTSPGPAVTISSATPNASAIVQIDADAAFEWIAGSYFAMVAGESFNASPATTDDAPESWPTFESNNLLPPVCMQIVDTGSGKYLSNGPVPLPAFFGDGKNPYRLIAPREFAPSATIQLNFSYIGPADRTYTIYPVLHGFKKYTELMPNRRGS